jgi:membrane protease YdiL (CAAX protease family)
MLIALPAWVFTSFILAQLVALAGIWALTKLGVYLPPSDDVVFNTVLAAVVYLLTLLIVIGVPWLIRRKVTTKEDVGLTRLPSWMDIVLAPAGAIVYLLFAAVLLSLFAAIFPHIDLQQAQDTGFQNLATKSQYLLAFMTLVIIAPLAEEVLFRGYLYGKLRKHVPLWLAMLVTSALFGAVHGQWNVALDTFALSIVMCSLREVTGSIWSGVLLHMIKNSIAFYFLFINPSLLGTLGG